MTNPGSAHQHRARTFFRVAGPVVLVVGVVVFATGVRAIFGDVDSYEGPSGTDIACFLGGFLLIGVGLQLSWVGFMSVAARYTAGEMAPVAKDSLEYLTEGKGLGNLGRSEAADGRTGPFCSRCGVRQDDEARFCDACGSPVG